MGTKPLWEKLRTLQCHFNWCLELKGEVDAVHILQTVALKMEHTAYRNRGVYLAMRGYLQQVQGGYTEALASLREAEAVLRQDYPATFSRQVLPIYGNYAWVYYRLLNYEKVELYLGRIHEICRSLSSPEQYSVEIPEIHAQKGWSLLAIGFRNGEEAAECFRMALQEDQSNQDAQAGLATSVFAAWTHSWYPHLWEEAKSLLEEILCREPQNYEVQVHLATLLEHKDRKRSMALTMEVGWNSLNPEDVRKAAKVCKKTLLPQAISLLQRAIALAPDYHLLHHDLGHLYKIQLRGAAPGERDRIRAAAIESFQRAVEADPQFVFPRLELAQLQGEKSPPYEAEMLQNLWELLPTASKRCQQAIYLHWGDFLLYRKGWRQEALAMYQAGYSILGGHSKEMHILKGKLEKLAKKFKEDSEMDRTQVAFETLRLTPEFPKQMKKTRAFKGGRKE